MKLEERIQNIKTLLKYCPHSSVDVRLHNKDNAKFFAKFFKGDRFQQTRYEHDELYIKIELARHVLTYDKNKNIIDEYPIQVSYCYDFDRDGEDWTSYYFDESLVRNNWMFQSDMYYKDLIKFEEWPDKVWERIQKELYDIATENLNKELESARSSVKYWENKKEEFDNKLNLNT